MQRMAVVKTGWGAALVVVAVCVLLVPGAAWAVEPFNPFRTERFVSEAAKTREAVRAKAERRDRSEERTARKMSREAHRGLSRAQARELARKSFPEAVEAPVWAPLSLRSGEHFDSYVNDFVARVKRDGQAPLLAKTFVPMRAEDQAGVKRRVSLELASRGRVIAPANPLVDVAIAKDARDGVRFAKTGIRVAPVGVAEVAGEIVGDRVLAENVATDTDQIVKPTPMGAQTDVADPLGRQPRKRPTSLHAALGRQPAPRSR